MDLSDELTVRERFGTKQRRADQRKPAHETVVGDDLHRDRREWRELERIIDRERDEYHEVIRDPTGWLFMSATSRFHNTVGMAPQDRVRLAACMWRCSDYTRDQLAVFRSPTFLHELTSLSIPGIFSRRDGRPVGNAWVIPIGITQADVRCHGSRSVAANSNPRAPVGRTVVDRLARDADFGRPVIKRTTGDEIAYRCFRRRVERADRGWCTMLVMKGPIGRDRLTQFHMRGSDLAINCSVAVQNDGYERGLNARCWRCSARARPRVGESDAAVTEGCRHPRSHHGQRLSRTRIRFQRARGRPAARRPVRLGREG